MVCGSSVEGFPRVMFYSADSCVCFVGFSFLVASVVMYELCFCLFRNEIGGISLCQKILQKLFYKGSQSPFITRIRSLTREMILVSCRSSFFFLRI
jgi:hypothetical protein